MTKVIDIVERKPIAVDRLLFNAERDPVSADALALMRGQLVAGTPISSALCCRSIRSAHDLVALANLLLDGEFDIGERGSHTAQNILHSFEPWALAGEGNLLDHVLPNELFGRADFPLIDDLRRRSAGRSRNCLASITSPVLSSRVGSPGTELEFAL